MERRIGRRASLFGKIAGVGTAALVFAALVGCGASSTEPRDQRLAMGLPNGPSTAKKAEPAERSVGIVAAALGATAAETARTGCRPGMVSIEGKFCIDRYEASLVEVQSDGEERAFSPYAVVANQNVRAVSEPNVYPQGYISRNQAEHACVASGKRLCEREEWGQACRGPDDKAWGYSAQRVPGRCNDKGKNVVVSLYGRRFDNSTMNRPELNQMQGGLSKTGEHEGCSNGYGVYDMVGNLHEWVADRDGTFYGGFYQDVASPGHGEGCGYRTTAHEARYHDYSTGFRCCADIGDSTKPEAKVMASPAAPPPTAPPARTPIKPTKKKSPAPRKHR